MEADQDVIKGAAPQQERDLAGRGWARPLLEEIKPVGVYAPSGDSPVNGAHLHAHGKELALGDRCPSGQGTQMKDSASLPFRCCLTSQDGD